MSKALQQVADRLAVSPQELQSIVLNTVMPNGGKQVTNDQFVSFMAVANEYKLNPMVKEIYAFPTSGGGIQPIVSIDGWLKVINSHPDFNGMVFEDVREGGSLIAITCKIFKKGIDQPVTVTEYMDECRGSSDPWKKWPSRMLRHKAAIQAGRYAFGLSGIIDPDEADRYQDACVIEKEPRPNAQNEQIEIINAPDLNSLIDIWKRINDEFKGSPDMAKLVAAKDQRKDELMQGDSDAAA